jgi:hypothetical protein
MKAQEYLEAKGLKVTPLKNVSVGRLSLVRNLKSQANAALL